MTRLQATPAPPREAAQAAEEAPGRVTLEARGEHDDRPDAPARTPELGRMLAWLRGQAVTPSGDVLSWVNPAHPGYPYPEAAGLLLTLLAEVDDGPCPLRDTIAARLERGLSPAGGVGRDGLDYAFDSAMALHGLLAHARASGAPRAGAVDRLYDFVADCIERRAAVGRGAAPALRWSTSWGCHQLKLTHALHAHGGAGRRPLAPLVDALLETLTPLGPDGRFVIYAGDARSYVHATCYALEGLLLLQRVAPPPRRDELAALLRAGARWLADVQRPDGALHAWHNGQVGWGPAPADIVAQSVRLWAALDREAFAAPIARGLTRLAALQAPEGGLRYLPGSSDINTWCTIFAAQAVLWSRPDARRGPLA